MTRPYRRAKTIARLTGDGMRRYFIELTNGQGLCKIYFSRSRDARKHLQDNISNSNTGARCVVYATGMDGEVVSACTYDEEGVIRYIKW